MSTEIEHLRAQFQAIQGAGVVRAWRLHPVVSKALCLVEGLLNVATDQEKRIRQLERRLAGLGALKVNP